MSTEHPNPFVLFALICAGLATVLLIWFLIARPALTRGTKLVLLVAIGILPLGTAANGSIAGYEATKTRTFCSSCHVMTPFGADSSNPGSTSLAARHGRNQAFGEENLGTCILIGLAKSWQLDLNSSTRPSPGSRKSWPPPKPNSTSSPRRSSRPDWRPGPAHSATTRA